MPLTPNENDVILGRGKLISAHPGNVRFRTIVSGKKETYNQSTDIKAKRKIAISVIEEIESLNPPGRFLIDTSGEKVSRFDEGLWVSVEREKAIEKALHRLREKKTAKNNEQPKDARHEDSKSNEKPINCKSSSTSRTTTREVISATGTGQISQPKTFDQKLLERKRSKSPNNEGKTEIILPIRGDPFGEGKSAPTNSYPTCSCQDNSCNSESSNSFIKPTQTLEHNLSMQFNPPLNSTTENISLIDDNSFDVELDAFISRQLNNDFDVHKQEKLTLDQWIDRSRPKGDSDLMNYIRSALLIALKLTDCLIRSKSIAKDDSHSIDIIPLEAIKTANVIITMAKGDSANEGQTITGFALDQKCNTTTVDCQKYDLEPKHPGQKILSVDFSTPAYAYPSLGSASSCLMALGGIMYELFSKGDRFELGSMTLNTRSVNELRLSFDEQSDDGSISTGQRSKKSTPCPGDDRFAHLIMRLGNIGIPHPVINLVENLLNSSLGEFSGDDVYRSLDDVRVDLQLMIDDPSRYLDISEYGSGQRLIIDDKVYGREEETARLRDAYNRCSNGECCGALILGEGGVGKSTFAMNSKKFTIAANGYFVSGKFDRDATRPFMVIGDVFNSMCDLFAADIQSIEQERKMAEALTRSLGSGACLLADIVPSLSNLMPLYTSCESSSFDAASRTRYLLLTLLDTLSKLSKSITILLDDLQWIDPASLTFCRALFQSTKSNKNVFLVLCSRESEVQTQDKSEVHDWLQSLSGSTLETIHLTNLNPEDVNNIVSDSLRTWPRLTRSLSAILHGKSLGNPFFLRQTMEMLCRGGYLHYSLGERKWKWDLDEISDLRLDDNVVSLLTREMTKLPDELLVGLKAASCIGYCIPQTVVDILSKHLEMDLFGVLTSLVQRSYLAGVGSALYRFTHDRIYQAAYELMSEKQRREDHMKFGLAICSYVLDNCENNYDMMFVGVNQINRGGPEVLADSCRRVMISQLNLNAGKRALLLTDFSSALSFFGHGIMFLNPGHWDAHYQLSLDLFTSAAESACATSDAALVKSYSETILAHSRSLDDRLPALCFAVKSLKESMNLPSCRDCAIEVLTQLGEDVSSVLEIPSQETIQITNNLLMSKMTDDSMIKMSPCTQMRAVFVMRLYHELNYVYYVFDQTRLLAISLRMVSLTFEIGLTDTSSLAFANYGVELIARGYLIGSRLGTVALKLAENSKYISYVIAAVKQYNLWVIEPLHAIAESHLVGFYSGKRVGDEFSSSLNFCLHLSTSFHCGKNLIQIKNSLSEYIVQLLENSQQWFLPQSAMLYWLIVELIEGPNFDLTEHNPLILNENGVMLFAASARHLELDIFIDGCKLMRSFLFRRDMTSCDGVLDRVVNATCQLRPTMIIAVFFEGLISFVMARQTAENNEWAIKGEIALAYMKRWESSKWNFKNKINLLEAEKMHFLGNFDLASQFYLQAVESSEKHKFLHELAICLELQGLFFQVRNLREKALTSLNRSVRCYKDWGANAVAERVEQYIQHHLRGC